MLNILEGYDLAADGPRSAATIHRITEAMRRAFADRARHLGDPDFNKDMPIERLISKEYAAAEDHPRRPRLGLGAPPRLRVAGGKR